MKIAIIGAGAAGLCAGRHCLRENIAFDIFEQTGNLGGTWNYTDLVGCDENGVPIHSSMYKGLRTNLPKELMAFEDFPYPKQNRSYLLQDEVLDYVRSYSDKFHINPHIKYFKRVIRIERQNFLWSVHYEDVKNKQKDMEHYDAVIICNGHYSDPFIPDVPGIESFSGRVKHSHDYRTPEPYANKKVLILGSGPSGLDISQQISNVATKVFLSHRSKDPLPVPDILHQKCLIKEFVENKAIFEDGTSEEIDDVVFCTGYNYNFPFLSTNCGVKITDNYVHPLYKQIISIENPTLAFLGIPFKVCPFPLFDIQVRFFLATLTGHFKLPKKEDMLQELVEEEKRKSGLPRPKYHELGKAQGSYFNDLSETAKIKMVPQVVQKLYVRVMMNRNRNNCFEIIDDDNFVQI
ncbi:senecionine N-oxygenase [Tribolium castaneum]|uniref:Flavin-containing monooxygenase n=1 Tax=Tribolium castaneum TaxID=7070 RepID=D6WSK9_TRICA|nr:PREDICTED: senecionine N-oxygenase [Tribolium castaneum]XP_015837619.1 PREDICTED: senecionine N-oxygenase [Tribolium castaneum]EFA05901.1 Senecionine N-oxygenase-like Protein [Tribolium castaneum]|eukprot:XP_008196295.1 PREDICTED: senecionine N-oxygenase [Tribolium castaneum]